MCEVPLTWNEVDKAGRVAVRIECIDRKAGLHNSLGYKGDSWGDRIGGLIAEFSVCKALGLEFTGKIGNFRKEPDVGDYEVKSTRLPWGKLIVSKKDDPDRRYLLVIVNDTVPSCNIIGWCTGHEARALGKWGTREDGSGGGWFVDRKHLHPFEALVAV